MSFLSCYHMSLTSRGLFHSKFLEIGQFYASVSGCMIVNETDVNVTVIYLFKKHFTISASKPQSISTQVTI